MCSFILLEIKARVDAMWEQMNKGIPNKTPNFILNKPRPTVNKKSKNSSMVRKLLSILFLMELLYNSLLELCINFFLILFHRIIWRIWVSHQKRQDPLN